MKKDNHFFLEHMLESITNIEEFVIDIVSEEEFAKSIKTRDAVLRNFEVIGEAANNLEEKFLNDNPEVEWKKIIGMRNIIIHEYFGVDLNLVWETIKNELPVFKESIKRLIQKLTP